MALTHAVRLHFRSLSLTNVPFQTQLTNAEKVYANYGIKVEFLSGMSLGLSDAEAKRFEKVDGSCEWKVTAGEFAELQRLGPPAPSSDIIVYYVQSFGEAGLLGCGGHVPGRPACIVAARSSAWDMAHEVGHVLLGSGFSPVHSTDTKNLMYPYSSNFPSTPVLTNAQVEQMKKSALCRKIAS